MDFAYVSTIFLLDLGTLPKLEYVFFMSQKTKIRLLFLAHQKSEICQNFALKTRGSDYLFFCIFQIN
jgi:hypothetical protein